MIAHRAEKRKALTLLEVVTALFIFLVGVTALLQLIQNASYRAARVDWKAKASLRCQSKLAELTVGWQDLQSTELQAFEDDETWQWRAQVDEEFEGLYRVHIEVRRELPNGEIIKSELSQLVLPPTNRGSSLDVFAAPASKSAGSSSTRPATGTEEGAAPAANPMGTIGATPSATPTTPPSATPAMPPTTSTPKGGGSKK